MVRKRLVTLNLILGILLVFGFLMLLGGGYVFTRPLHTGIALGYIATFVACLYYSRKLSNYIRSITFAPGTFILILQSVVFLYAALLLLGLFLSYADVKAKGAGYRIYAAGGFLGLPQYRLYDYCYVVEKEVAKGGNVDYEDDIVDNARIESVTIGDSIIVELKRRNNDTSIVFYK